MSIEEHDISKDDENILNKIQSVRQSLIEADNFMQQTKASTVALGIDLTTLEINLLLKKMFLCVFNKVPTTQYDWLSTELMQKMNLIFKIVENKFGRDKDVPQGGN